MHYFYGIIKAQIKLNVKKSTIKRQTCLLEAWQPADLLMTFTATFLLNLISSKLPKLKKVQSHCNNLIHF